MAGITTSTTLSAEYRNFFSEKLLTYPVQNTILDQFATKVAIPKNGGNKGITMFRYGAPAMTDIQTLTEGTIPASSTAAQLALTSISKSLAQYAESVYLTDIIKMTDLLKGVNQATKRLGLDFTLWCDSVLRNTAVGSNLTLSGANLGTGVENGGTLDNSDVLTEVYGQPATTAQTYTGLNSDTTTSTCNSPAILDLVTKLKINRAPELEGGGYAYVTDPRVSRDVMRDTDWLNASNYGNKGQPFYRGEVGSVYGVRVVEQTNSFQSLGSATATDRYIYSSAATGGTAAAKAIICSFMIGQEAWGVPQLSGDSPFSPSINILDQADKSDRFNQNVIVAAKAYFAGLRQNPNYYIVHRTKTANTL